MAGTFLARQPIVDGNLRVHAYEILFRDGADEAACKETDGDRATAAVVLRSLTGLGLDRLTSGRLAFINCTPKLLHVEGLDQILPPNRVVLEILEDIEPHPVLIERIRALSKRGYRIALDDFAYRPDLEPLLELADYVKIDLRTASPADLLDISRRRRSKRFALIAEKVEDYEEFRRCADLGFDHFQGWFFCKPETLRSNAPVPNRVTAIQLMARLHQKNVEIEQVVRLVTLDPQLSYSVLRIANSSIFACPVAVKSVHEGIMRIGMSNLRRWIAIMLMSRLDDKPAELLTTAVIRGRMCEILGGKLGGDPEGLFTVGLFSVLEALFDRPLDDILAAVPLASSVVDALWLRPGIGGEILRAVLAHEQGSWTDPGRALSHATVTDAWLAALDWTEKILIDLGLVSAPPSPVVARAGR